MTDEIPLYLFDVNIAALAPEPVEPPPADFGIHEVDPAVGTTDGGTAVEIRGIGFMDVDAVKFDGVAATDLVVVDDATITATTPAGDGLVAVSASKPTGETATLLDGFEYVTIGVNQVEFTQPGAHQWQVPAGITAVEVLVVGGGGGGGRNWGGGGGAGRVLHKPAFAVNAGEIIDITVGAGGNGSPSNAGDPGSNGDPSTFATLTALGGGGGGNAFSSFVDGITGGSGGGAASGGTGGAADASEGGLGNPGASAGLNEGVGGGGAGAAGTDPNGGVGVDLSSSFGTAVGENGWFGGGGGGRNNTQNGAGGTGGGGDDEALAGGSLNGAANTGGGGGGATAGSSGGKGGSGIVIVKY